MGIGGGKGGEGQVGYATANHADFRQILQHITPLARVHTTLHCALETLTLSKHLLPLARVQGAPHGALAADNAQDVACATEHDTGPVEVGNEPQAPFGVAPHQAQHNNVVLAPLSRVRRNDSPSVSRVGHVVIVRHAINKQKKS